MDSINWGSIVQKLTELVSSGVQNPTGATIFVVIITVILGGVLIFLRKKIRQWEIEKARQETEKGRKDYLDGMPVENKPQNDSQQEGRDSLESVPKPGQPLE